MACRLHGLFQNPEAEAEFFVLEELAPINEEESADNDEAGGEGKDAFPIRLAVKKLAQVLAGVFAGENQNAVGNEASEKEGDEDMKRTFQSGHRHRGEEGGRREWREGIEKDKNRRGPLRFSDFVTDVAKVGVLAPIHQRRRNFRDVTSENVAANRRAGHADGDGEPWIELKFHQENNEKNPGWRGEDRDGVDRQGGEEDEKVRPHWYYEDAANDQGSALRLLRKFDSLSLDLGVRQHPDEGFVVEIDNLDAIAKRIAEVTPKSGDQFDSVFAR